MVKLQKCQLTNELEKLLDPNPHAQLNADTNYAFVVDVMAYVRKLKFGALKTFRDVCVKCSA